MRACAHSRGGSDTRNGGRFWPRGSHVLLFHSHLRPHERAEMQADIAQLVERNLAKVEVASSSLVVRSEGLPRKTGTSTRWVGREARQRTANPSTRVQIPYPPRSDNSRPGRLAQR